MKTPTRRPEAPESTPSMLPPAELIRLRLDEGFAAVQTGKMRSQMGASDAGAVTRAYVDRTVATVRVAIQSATFTESQLAVINKKIQALKDAAGRIDSA